MSTVRGDWTEEAKGREGNAFSRKEGTDGRTQKDTDLIEGNEGAGMLE